MFLEKSLNEYMYILDKLEPFTIIMNESSLVKCPRCRRYSVSTASILCQRCSNIVSNKSKVTSKA